MSQRHSRTTNRSSLAGSLLEDGAEEMVDLGNLDAQFEEADRKLHPNAPDLGADDERSRAPSFVDTVMETLHIKKGDSEEYKEQQLAEEEDAVKMDDFYDSIAPGVEVGGQEDEETASRRAWSTRVAICVLAVALIWTTSLVVAKSIVVAVIEAPPRHEVFDAAEQAINITLAEQDAYAACVPRQLSVCNSALNTTINQLTSTADAASEFNEDLVASVTDTSSDCSSALVQVLDSLTEYQRAGGTLEYTVQCSAAEQEQVRNMAGDISEVRSGAFIVAKDFSRGATELLGNTEQSVQNYTTYNENYVDEKTRELQQVHDDITAVSGPRAVEIQTALDPLDAAFTDMLACVGVTTGCPGVGARELVEQAQADLTDAYEDVRFAFDQAALQTELYVQAVENTFTDVADIFSELQAVPDALASIGIVIDVFPSLNVPPPPEIELPDLVEVTGADEIWAATEGYANDFADELTGAANEVNLAAARWTNDVVQTTDPVVSVFTDYQPPAVRIDTSAFEESAEEFNENMAVALSAFAEIVPDEDTQLPPLYQGSLEIGPIGDASQFEFEYAELDGDIEFDWFFILISTAVNVGLIFDSIYRAARSYQLIVKFLRRGAVYIPPVDVREHKTRIAPRERTVVKVASVLSNPFLLGGVALAFFVLVVSLALQAYTPFYNDYVDGCVEKTANGTLLTRNLYAIAFNYASNEGDSDLVIGLDKYDIRRAEACGQLLERSTGQRETLAIQLATAQQSLNSTSGKMALLDKCLDFSSYPSPDDYRNLTSREYPATIIQNADECRDASVFAAELQQGVTSCDVMPPCTVTCDNPNEDLIYNATFQAGCYAEWATHAWFLQFALSLLIYIALNIARILFVKGICMINQRALTRDHGYTFLGSCSLLGNTASHKHLAKPLTRVVRRTERFGVGLVVFSFLVHIPYIIVLVAVSRNLVFA